MEYKNPVCKGSIALGNACGICERCVQAMAPVPLVKPTLGLRPYNIWLYCRIQEITEALQRQADQGEELNMTWVLEMQEITEMIKEK